MSNTDGIYKLTYICLYTLMRGLVNLLTPALRFRTRYWYLQALKTQSICTVEY